MHLERGETKGEIKIESVGTKKMNRVLWSGIMKRAVHNQEVNTAAKLKKANHFSQHQRKE